MNLIFANDETIEVLGVHGSSQMYQGVSRDFLTFIFPVETDITELSKKFTPSNMRIFGLDDGDSVSYHSDYTIFVAYGSGYQDHILHTPIQTERKCSYVIMAQSTMAERQMQNQQEIIDVLLVSELEG